MVFPQEHTLMKSTNRNNLDQASSAATLDHASIGHALTVRDVQAPQAAPEWAHWLEEIGFIVG